jgi:nitrile hydratase accessory protein
MIVPDLPGRAGPPSFTEPWHAQAFAAVVALNQAGHFTWAEWVEIFSAEIAHEPQRDGEESEEAYYRQWLAALERLIANRGLVLAEEITATANHWRRSYLHTPHGKPVGLRRDLSDVPTPAGHVHHHRHRNSTTPVAVHPGSLTRTLRPSR